MKTIALVGCGRISARHVEAIDDTNGVDVALVCDKDEARAKTLATKLDVPYVTDYREIRDVDVISVLTPSGLHPRHVSNIAELTNAPHIVCEKPLSLTLREAHEVYRRVEKAGKVLLPVYQNRYNPLVKLIKDLIETGKLGKIHQFVCNVLWNRNDAYFNIDWHGTAEFDGGVLYTQASHYVDMLHYFFGELAEHKGIGGKMRGLEVFDTLSAALSFRNGAVGTLNTTVSVYETNYLTEFVLIAEKGTIRLSGTNLNTIDFWNVEGMERPDMDFTINHQYGKGHDALYEYVAQKKWDMFPAKADVLSGIRMMEMLSY
ncbi:MAG: Gfo/Idh/MocA family oxidoreductase [Verrucomicrobia bacterium]|jgi:UDP-N-acetyl-2-amino-2-deoxyglucuronate dehydrogenase|nr:Gfo/Idh/MocA family oxidoreductase [Verrucomicrobiota bacterium]